MLILVLFISSPSLFSSIHGYCYPGEFEYNIKMMKYIYIWLQYLSFFLTLRRSLPFTRMWFFQITLYPINVVSKHICNWLMHDQFSSLLFVICVIQSLSLSILSHMDVILQPSWKSKSAKCQQRGTMIM